VSFIIYIHNLENGDNHFGCVFNKERIYIRNAERYTLHRIDSMIDLSLNDHVEATWEEIDELIEYAYSQIGPLHDNMRYRKNTSKGEFEIIYKKGLWDTPQKLKEDLRSKIGQLKSKIDNQVILKIS